MIVISVENNNNNKKNIDAISRIYLKHLYLFIVCFVSIVKKWKGNQMNW